MKNKTNILIVVSCAVLFLVVIFLGVFTNFPEVGFGKIQFSPEAAQLTDNIKTAIEEATPETEVCQENWQCDNWSDCIEGEQTRNCEDLNGCGMTDGKPSDELSCESITKDKDLAKPIYLIIDTEEVYDAAEELVNYRSADFDIYHIKISSISQTPTSQIVRQYITNFAITHSNLKYILLIGRVEDIPTFYFIINGLSVPTDFFYSNILSGSEELPDVALGRIPCDNSDELKDIIYKIKSFESESTSLNDVLLFGNGPEVAVYGLSHGILLNDLGLNAIVINESDVNDNNRAQIISEIAEGKDVGVYYGHGGTFYMPPFEGSEIPQMNNKPFILMSGGCETMNFDSSFSGLCIGYSFLKDRTGGSVASMGATRKGGFGCKYSFIEGFFRLQNNGTELGERILQALEYEQNMSENECVPSLYTFFTKRFTLLGDPALKVVIIAQCSDGIDNDNDGKCDYAGCYINGDWKPADPNCISYEDNSEEPTTHEFKDNNGISRATLTDEGNIYLSGSCIVRGNCAISNSLFEMRNNVGAVASSIDSRGNLCLSNGNCNNRGPCVAGVNDFIVKSEDGTVNQIVLSENGGLCHMGQIYLSSTQPKHTDQAQQSNQQSQNTVTGFVSRIFNYFDDVKGGNEQ